MPRAHIFASGGHTSHNNKSRLIDIRTYYSYKKMVGVSKDAELDMIYIYFIFCSLNFISFKLDVRKAYCKKIPNRSPRPATRIYPNSKNRGVLKIAKSDLLKTANFIKIGRLLAIL